MAQTVNNPPAMPETQVRSRCPEDPLEEGMATHSSTRAWEIPWTEEPGGLQPMGPKEPGTPERLTLSLWRVWQGWGPGSRGAGVCWMQAARRHAGPV